MEFYMKKVVLYSRTSHWESNPQNQINELKQVANRFGWTIIKEYTDKGISGAKGRDGRPEFDAMLKSAMKKECDVVMFWAVDRASRNLTLLFRRWITSTLRMLECISINKQSIPLPHQDWQ